MPLFICRAKRCARCRLRVHRPPPSPYRCRLQSPGPLRRPECAHGHERAEHLFLRHAVGAASPQQSRLDVAAVGKRGVVRRLAAEQDLAALLARDIDIRQHAVTMLARRQRPHLGRRIERIADPDRTRQRDEMLKQFVGDRFMQRSAASRNAGLALVMKDAERGALHDGVEIGVGEYDVRRPCRRVRAAPS